MILNKKTFLNFFNERPNRPYSLSQILNELSIPPGRRVQVRTILRELADDGALLRLRNKHFVLPRQDDTITGVIELHQRGFGFVRPITTAVGSHDIPDIFIPPPYVGDALPDDKVEVRIVKERKAGPEGRIVRILERGHRFIVGKIIPHRRRPRLMPRDRKFLREIELNPDRRTRSLGDDVWVLAQITDWTPQPHPLVAEVVEILGTDDEPRIGVTLLIKDLGIQDEFPKAVLAEAEAIPPTIPEEEITRRTDFRASPIFTIDPADAKDFDDALGVRLLPNGNFELTIHIADVTHYVRPDTALDAEALRRATSIYPIDRVVPMLPERLSNGICSLRPNEDRLVMSIVAEIDSKGNVRKKSFHEGVICSHHRFTYEEVQAILDGTDRGARERCPAPLVKSLRLLGRLAKILIAHRDRSGRLDMDIPEARILFDSDGHVRDIIRKPRLFSNRVVEECMLLANELVAEHLAKKNIPFLYRIHEEPNIEKLNRIANVFSLMGVVFDPERAMDQKYFCRILQKLEGRDAGHILHTFLLRAMMRARYSPENLGHYGLASEFYCHFTSPIRRYPDVNVHRQLRAFLRGEIASQGTRKSKAKKVVNDNNQDAKLALLQLAEHCSALERRASEVEYEAYRIKAMEFMDERLGDEFDGHICGMTQWGLFVELKQYPVEGLIPVAELEGDYYEFDDKAYIMRGRESGQVFRLAQPVRVWVHSLDRMNQTLSLRLCDDSPVSLPLKKSPVTAKKKKGTRRKKPRRR